MPQRFLKPGLTDSVKWNSLDWDAQSCYVRLITRVDDYGRYDADLRLLKGHLFALRQDVSLLTLENICSQMSAQGLVEFYRGPNGKPYLQLTNWQERARSESRFPDPKDPLCKHLLTFDNNCLLPSPSPSPQPSPTPTPSPARATPTESVCVEKCSQPDPKDLARDIAAQKRPENGFTVFDLKASLCILYNRQPEAPWSYEEERLAVSIAKRPECRKELAEINQFRAGLAEKKYFPNKLLRLLEDWTGTLDRARAGKNGIGPKLADVIAFVKEKCPTDDRAAGWGASFYSVWQKRCWARKGLPIDWKVELSKQVATWRKEA